MFCHKCGEKGLEDASFCAKCGAKLTVDNELNTVSPEQGQAINTPQHEIVGTPSPTNRYEYNDDNAVVKTTNRPSREFFIKLIDGDFGLAKTYWWFVFVLGSVLSIPLTFILKYEAIVIYAIPCLLYQIVALIGLWRAATKYKGSWIWSGLSKAVCVLGWLSVISIPFIIYGAKIANTNNVPIESSSSSKPSISTSSIDSNSDTNTKWTKLDGVAFSFDLSSVHKNDDGYYIVRSMYNNSKPDLSMTEEYEWLSTTSSFAIDCDYRKISSVFEKAKNCTGLNGGGFCMLIVDEFKASEKMDNNIINTANKRAGLPYVPLVYSSHVDDYRKSFKPAIGKVNKLVDLICKGIS